jgi:hypothetical protein
LLLKRLVARLGGSERLLQHDDGLRHQVGCRGLPGDLVADIGVRLRVARAGLGLGLTQLGEQIVNNLAFGLVHDRAHAHRG